MERWHADETWVLQRLREEMPWRGAEVDVELDRRCRIAREARRDHRCQQRAVAHATDAIKADRVRDEELCDVFDRLEQLAVLVGSIVETVPVVDTLAPIVEAALIECDVQVRLGVRGMRRIGKDKLYLILEGLEPPHGVHEHLHHRTVPTTAM
eukprot:410572-Prymnesium_polylepis.2